jgi:hypothetical protein
MELCNSVFSKLYNNCILGQPKITKIKQGKKVHKISINCNSVKEFLKKKLIEIENIKQIIKVIKENKTNKLQS